jgi:glycosyltransferase involved in cell wall biosynthesis
MKILILSQWFEPEPTFKGLAFAKELVRRGHQVEVLTGFPNYPGGRLYPGYRVRLWQRECIDGIAVLRVPLYPSHGRSALGRIANYVSFAFSAALGSAFVARPDLVYVYHPPATIGLAALAAKMFYRIPIVYDIQDLWPDSVATSGMMGNRRILQMLHRWCQLIYRKSERIVVLSPGFKSILVERGVAEEKIEVIYNWSDERALGASERPPVVLGAPGEFTVLFAGTMGVAQALDTVLDAARLCMDAVPRARFVLIGGGIDRERLERRAAEMELTNLCFLPRQPGSEIGRYLSAADVLLVHLRNEPLYRITIPSKTQAYLASGKPILMAVEGDAAALVQRSGAGLTCAPNSPDSLAGAVAKMASFSTERLNQMGAAGRDFYLRELSMAVGVDNFERIFAAAYMDARAARAATAAR